jgi:hypothetical protein
LEQPSWLVRIQWWEENNLDHVIELQKMPRMARTESSCASTFWLKEWFVGILYL